LSAQLKVRFDSPPEACTAAESDPLVRQAGEFDAEILSIRA